MSIERNAQLPSQSDDISEQASSRMLADVNIDIEKPTLKLAQVFRPGLQDPDQMNREYYQRQGVFNPDSWERFVAPLEDALKRHRRQGNGGNWRDRIIDNGGRCNSNGACVDRDGYYVPGS